MNTSLTRRSTLTSASITTADVTFLPDASVASPPQEEIQKLEEAPLIKPLQKYTIDEAINHMGIGWYQIRLLLLTGMLGAADAMEMMLLSFLLPKLQRDWHLKPPWDGMIGAVVFVGQFIGTTVSSMVADKYGRKYSVRASIVGCAIFGTCSALASSPANMLCIRFIVGICVGAGHPAYTLFAEYCPTKNRGQLLVIQESFWAIGCILSVLFAWISLSDRFSFFRGNNDWRWFLCFSATPFWILCMFYKLIPESPRWYLAANKLSLAQDELHCIAKCNHKSLPKGTLKMSANVNLQRGRLKDIFCVEQYRFTSILLYISLWCCVLCYYGISFISERYFEVLGSMDLYSEMAISTLSEIPSLFLGLVMLDRFGRRGSMMICNTVFAVCCIGLSTKDDIGVYGVLAVFVARMMISLGFSTIYVYFAEYYPTVVRSTALGCASSCARSAAVLTSFISQDLSIKMGMMIYGLAGVVGLICNQMLAQDTTGRELTTSTQSSVNLLKQHEPRKIAI